MGERKERFQDFRISGFRKDWIEAALKPET
jgi:hypothetical protein